MSSLPTPEKCIELLKNSGCSNAVINHCKSVRDFAVKIAKKANADVRLVEVGALLHDIGRSKTHGIKHGIEGAEIAKNELADIIDTAGETDAQYSIQVGLYGIKVNAERRVDKLISQQLSGHLTNFINEKGDTLYNVRFGYILDKASVIAALDIYQQKHTGDGYIVRLKNK